MKSPGFEVNRAARSASDSAARARRDKYPYNRWAEQEQNRRDLEAIEAISEHAAGRLIVVTNPGVNPGYSKNSPNDRLARRNVYRHIASSVMGISTARVAGISVHYTPDQGAGRNGNHHAPVTLAAVPLARELEIAGRQVINHARQAAPGSGIDLDYAQSGIILDLGNVHRAIRNTEALAAAQYGSVVTSEVVHVALVDPRGSAHHLILTCGASISV
jgi:hypothetical protein